MILYKNIGRNVLIGAVSSIVALNLGLAMGILSGRDGFLGMVSAGLIAIVTAFFGGAKVAGSGPTAPMSALAAVVLAAAAANLDNMLLNPDQFLNLVLFIAAVFLTIMSFLKLGRLISCIPGVVISGFMSGIGLMIWHLQYQKIIGPNSLNGSILINATLAIVTFLIALFFPLIFRKICPKLAPLVPGTLVALILVTISTHVFSIDVEFLQLMSEEKTFLPWLTQLPTHWPHDLDVYQILTALPFALELAVLCYLDTMLTLVIIEKMRQEKADRDQELRAQGYAMGLMGLIGGVPGAQSTVPSVLLTKEGADSKWAGVSMGFFALLGVFLFVPLINYIPSAVIVGILLKVGWNVFDFKPIRAFLDKKDQFNLLGLFLITLTAVLVVFVDIIFAVFVVAVLFHLMKRIQPLKSNIVDWNFS